MLLLETLAENQIKAAVDRGELDNLPGSGRPLALDDDSHVPSDLRASYRILKNAGYLPPGISLISEVRQLEALVLTAESESEKTRLITRLGLLRTAIAAR